MDIIDQKFEKLKEQVYKLGIAPVQFRNMVEGHSLFEWSPEVALELSQRFCSWVVAEEDAEQNCEDTEDEALTVVSRSRSRFESQILQTSN